MFFHCVYVCSCLHLINRWIENMPCRRLCARLVFLFLRLCCTVHTPMLSARSSTSWNMSRSELQAFSPSPIKPRLTTCQWFWIPVLETTCSEHFIIFSALTNTTIFFYWFYLHSFISFLLFSFVIFDSIPVNTFNAYYD